MAEILKGKVVADKIKEEITRDVEDLKKNGINPTLGIVRLGKNPDDIFYERSIIKNCNSVGISTSIVEEDESITTEKLVEIIERLNKDDFISGILVFRPLPKHIDEEVIRNVISPKKDIDCMNPINLEKIFEGDMTGFAPCTPKAAVEILLHNNVSLEGKNVVIINRSMVVGKPLAMMLLEENATVTICHSRTKDLHKVTSNADIVMTALGRPKYFDKKYFKEESIVIDIGISEDENGKISGDIDFEDVKDYVKMITPVPNGVGSITTSILLKQTVNACK
ncbi:bifunctional 5,10-methylenetetrahydrofolate dehydrogenase/5,10-methenyltetrahydrofolate cyclohydrolase [Wansuia hejianensis]|uniref:Bifunctional protein FolD n=1 Tax=Wansuia hejianensis TaxID=2763667 RepID=A0A926EVQ3_9FIRM|nr:bifunctional 5,10-methylenetetrahydrofolate dehydrogenase/5,10-methenyltetrahydrofolate cyclohydrolase [Wansuia hejianensis]MBC8590748.1 bifunctional 5,10-methylenetetrahydrofolate dehydrogenase/5,10-methenyltetrahydrofolate cyclohydrolase [Wansuia hejianensis]